MSSEPLTTLSPLDLRAAVRRGLSPVPDDHAPVVLTSDYDLSPLAQGLRRDPDKLRPAAVLVPLVERQEGLTVLLTQRTDHLRSHAGQIAFPGGRVEESDNGPVDTALRETEEEIGLHRRHVDVAGSLDVYETGTGFAITPIVGFVRPAFDLVIDPEEVAEAFEVPLHFFLDPNNHLVESRQYQGVMRHYYVMPYEGRRIWGATAGMLMGLYRRLVG